MMWIKLPEKIKSLIKSSAFLNWKKCAWIFLLAVIIGFGIILPTDYASAWGPTDWLIENILLVVIAPIIGCISWMGILIAGFFVDLSASILDSVMRPEIYNEILGKAFEVDPITKEPTGFINIAWTAVRDLVNMFFILILLLIAFGTILRIEAYKAKNLLPKLIIAIFLVNFSKIISLIAIDFSQVFMYSLYNQIGSFEGSQGDLIQIVREFAHDYNPVHIKSLLSIEEAVGAFGACVFSFLLGFTYLALAAFMIIRLAMLCLVVVLSPAAFILLVLPSTKQYFSKWMNNLVKYSIIGPIFVFFIWLSGLMAFHLFHQAAIPPVNISDASDVHLSGLSGAFQNIIPFGVIIFMLLYSMQAAKQLGIWGAAAVDKMTVAAGIAGGFVIGRFTKGAVAGGANRWLAKGGKIPGMGRLTGGIHGRMKGTRFEGGRMDKFATKLGKAAEVKQKAIGMLSPEVLKRGYKAHIAEEEAEAYGVPAGRLQDLANRVKGKETNWAELAEDSQVADFQRKIATENPAELADMYNKFIKGGLYKQAKAVAYKIAAGGNTDTLLQKRGYENSYKGYQEMMQKDFVPQMGTASTAVFASDIANLEKKKGNYSYAGATKYDKKLEKIRFSNPTEQIEESAEAFASAESRFKGRTFDARTMMKETSAGWKLDDIGREILDPGKNHFSKEDLNRVSQFSTKMLNRLKEDEHEIRKTGKLGDEMMDKVIDALG